MKSYCFGLRICADFEEKTSINQKYEEFYFNTTHEEKVHTSHLKVCSTPQSALTMSATKVLVELRTFFLGLYY